MKPNYKKLLRILNRGNAAFVLVSWGGEPERIRVVTPDDCQWYSVWYGCFRKSCFLGDLFEVAHTPGSIVRAMERYDEAYTLEVTHVQELK